MNYKFTNQLPKLSPKAPIFIDTETYGSKDFYHENIRLLQLYQPDIDNTVYVVDVSGYPKEVLREYISQFENIFGYNLLYDFEVLNFDFSTAPAYNDLYLASKIAFYERYLQPAVAWDLYSVLSDIGIQVNIDKKKMQKSDFSALLLTEEQIIYSAYDVYYLPTLKKVIEDKVNKIWTHNRVYRLDLFTARTLLNIQRIGLQVNEEKKLQLYKQTKQELEAILKQLPFNPLSPKQVAKYFSTPSSSEEILTDIKYNHHLEHFRQIADLTLKARELKKTLSFLETYNERVYGKFNVVGSKSGRMSCSNENLQQIPRHLRQIFGFSQDDGRVYVIADFPQIELRLAGSIWKEQNMITAFRQGIDLHKLTASAIYNKHIDDVEKQERQIAKSANFGLLYGMGADRFKQYVFTTTGIQLDIEEAKIIRAKWLDMYPSVKKKHYEVGQILQTNFYQAQTWLGRPYITKSYTEALNIQIQGSGADLLKTTIKNLFMKNPNLKVCNLIHDEIVIETTSQEAEDVANLLKEVMKQSWQECIQYAKIPIEKFDLEVEKPDITKSLEKS